MPAPGRAPRAHAVCLGAAPADLRPARRAAAPGQPRARAAPAGARARARRPPRRRRPSARCSAAALALARARSASASTASARACSPRRRGGCSSASALMCASMVVRARGPGTRSCAPRCRARASTRSDALQGTFIGVLMSATLPARLGEPSRALIVARRTGRPREHLPDGDRDDRLPDAAQRARAGDPRRRSCSPRSSVFTERHRALVRGRDRADRRARRRARRARAAARRRAVALAARPGRGAPRPRRAGPGAPGRARLPHAAARAWRPPLLQLSAWAIQWLSCYALLVALGPRRTSPGLGAAAAVLFAVNVTAVLPATPSNLGVFQAACVAVLVELRRRLRRRAGLRDHPPGRRDRHRGHHGRAGARQGGPELARRAPAGHAHARRSSSRRCRALAPRRRGRRRRRSARLPRWLVDGMNVIGARPDGWWRDRRAAMRRLTAALDALAARTRRAGHRGLRRARRSSVAGRRASRCASPAAAGRTPPTTTSPRSSPPTRAPHDLRVVTSDGAAGRDRCAPAGAEVVGAGAFRRTLDALRGRSRGAAGEGRARELRRLGLRAALRRRLALHGLDRRPRCAAWPATPPGTASAYTRSRRPVELALALPMADRTAARREEARIKRLPRAAKLALVEG